MFTVWIKPLSLFYNILFFIFIIRVSFSFLNKLDIKMHGVNSLSLAFFLVRIMCCTDFRYKGFFTYGYLLSYFNLSLKSRIRMTINFIFQCKFYFKYYTKLVRNIYCLVMDIWFLFAELFLSENDVQNIYDFEEECVEGYFREKETQLHMSTEEQVRFTTER